MKNYLRLVLLALIVLTSSLSCKDIIDNKVVYLTYNNLNVTESAANDGTFSATIDIEVIGDEFVGTLNEGDAYVVTNLNDELTATMTRVDDQNATLTISGTVTDHVRCAIETAGLIFYSDGFVSGQRPQNASVDINVSFAGASYAVTGENISESSPNSGSFSGVATLTLGGGATITAGSLVEDVHFSLIDDMPDGLIVSPAITSTTTLTFGVAGSAGDNTSADSETVTIKFLDTNLNLNTVSPFSGSAFCSNEAVRINLGLLFADCSEISLAASTISEAGANDGSITATVNITLAGGAFNPAITAGDVVFSGTPAGLTPVITYVGANTVSLSFTGMAASHADANDTDIDLTFQASGLTAASEFCDDGNTATLSVNFAD
ncbi:MAG: hypothetical protein KDD46_07435 [Bdellovibrionales bacterium]|nr:hypothetical protein [Bdellovibrionales bacterium]